VCVLVDIKYVGTLKFSLEIICFFADIFHSVNDSSLNEAFLSMRVLGYAMYILSSRCYYLLYIIVFYFYLSLYDANRLIFFV
jgi:hypothetical protein